MDDLNKNTSVAFVALDKSIKGRVEDGLAVALLASRSQLVDYAGALFDSGRDFARFLWQSENDQWLQVTLERQQDVPLVKVTTTASSLPAGLTSREIDVLTLLVGGLSNREIAACLVLSVRTVSTHVEHLLDKLGETSRAGAAAVAAERGWLCLPIRGRNVPTNNLTVSILEAQTAPKAASFSSSRRVVPTKRPLVVGSLIPLSGPAAADGREMINGSTLAISELNARGGISGRWIEHIVVDTDIFSIDHVELAFRRLADAGVDSIMSGYVFVEDAAREAAVRYGVPYLHSMTSEAHAAVVADDPIRYAGIFQVCPTELHYPSSFLHFVDDLRANGRWRHRSNRIAFIDTTLPGGKMVTEVTITTAKQLGLDIVLVETVDPMGVDWASIVERVVRAEPDAVMITQFLASELASFQHEISNRAPHVLVFATYTPSIPEFLELAGPAAEGIVWTTVTGTYSDTIGHDFEKRFQRLHGQRPGRSQAGLAYDGIHLLAQAWRAVPDSQDFNRVVDRLRLNRYRGVNGSYSFDNASQSGLNFPYTTSDPSLGQAHLVFQVQDGEHRIIGPAPYAEAVVRC